MTEAEWLSEARPEHVLNGVRLRRKKTQPRKYRLFMCACCRELPPAVLTRPLRQALDVAERFADSQAGLENLRDVKIPPARFAHTGKALMRFQACNAVRTACETMTPDSVGHLAWLALICLTETSSAHLGRLPDYRRAHGKTGWAAYLLQEWDVSDAAVAQRQIGLIYDIFGNPFRLVTLESRWQTSDVLGLARAIYEKRAYERMPILADALMDAGCADEQILGHCRGDGPHVRGCWVVDLVLGKE